MFVSRFLPTLTICMFVVVLATPASSGPFTNGMDGTMDVTIAAGPSPDYVYRNFTVIKDILYATEAEFPGIAKVIDIGDSWEKTQGIADRDILAIKISDNVEIDEGEPEVLIMALQHAREWPAAEIATQLIENMTALYGSDDRISWLVDNRETWIVPVVNPDGLDYSMADPLNDGWRKNRRDNGDGTFGVDLNRNYNGSQNGDPLGEWGGAGTSSYTSNDLYCGEYPFSEPETQAIRDLALNRSFVAAIDFHTYSDLVMWPWGYTTDLPPDNDDLVRIGNALAALNGYTADQSVGLYPTTGDSLDWLYGGVDVYAILFEVGGSQDGFHPEEEDTVLAQIAENIPPALLLIEMAGDRNDRQFDIDHVPLSGSVPVDADLDIEADITAARGVDTDSTTLHYRVNGGSWVDVSMPKTSGNDTYSVEMPFPGAGASVEYFISASDEGGVSLSSPMYAPYDVHIFSILLDDEDPVADAGADISGYVGMPVPFTGSGSTDDVGIDNYTWSFTYDSSPVELYGVSPSYTFLDEGEYVVTLVVRDTSGNTDSDAVIVTISSEAIPEFSQVVLPVVALLALFTVFRFGRGRKLDE
ncbi:MAG TPA: M14 family zinc carboxypeptidase [Thermoplasmata archaeon]|nr:M14 family zinc carboxypeptidase [Thermoplasmata archaeon]